MSYEFFISLRYLKAKRKQAFISLISAISIGGVAVGVAALIIVLAVMTGFKDDIRDKILGIMAHILIQTQGGEIELHEELLQTVQQMRQVDSILPYISGQVMVSSSENVSGVKLLGIDPERTAAVQHLEKSLIEGHVELLKQTYPNQETLAGPPREGIILGWELSRLLGVLTGDEITLILPMGRLLPTGPVPKLKKFRVVGIFSSGFYEYDAGLAYIPLTTAQKFFNMETKVSGLEVRIKNIDNTRYVVQQLSAALGSEYIIQDWADLNQSLFSAINLEKLAMFLILALIVLVAAFNIISTLVMMVIEKQSDIAILKSMGATSRSIMAIFMLEGTIIGWIGTILGTGLGIVVCWVVDTFKLIHLDGGSYYLDHLPLTMTAADILIVIVSALVICVVSTIYPARQASTLDPVAALRYE